MLNNAEKAFGGQTV